MLYSKIIKIKHVLNIKICAHPVKRNFPCGIRRLNCSFIFCDTFSIFVTPNDFVSDHDACNWNSLGPILAFSATSITIHSSSFSVLLCNSSLSCNFDSNSLFFLRLLLNCDFPLSRTLKRLGALRSMISCVAAGCCMTNLTCPPGSQRTRIIEST